MPNPFPTPQNGYLQDQARLILNSYLHWTGVSLIHPMHSGESPEEQLFKAPFVLASHDTLKDPLFNYANLKALELFGYPWEEWTQLPSRLSAEPQNQESRARLLKEVEEKGYSDGYRGVRIGRNGRFEIMDACVWNILDANGAYAGQAASFTNWRWLTH